VTGAAQGMGAAIARRLARDGFTVAVNDLPGRPELEAMARELGGLAVPADIADTEAVARAVAGLSVDILVANAAYMAMAPFAEQDPAQWWRHIDVNLTGAYNLVRAVLPGMRARRGGRIVVIASEWGVTGWPNATAYAASKAGLISFVKTLGRELAPEGIIVNGIAPGVTDTPQLEVDARDAGVPLDEIRGRYAAETPLGRIGRPEEIAATVAFLCSPAVGSLVGQILQPNGGTTRAGA
jgi:NAD(P)-dependent dehydrogenase (short-subunit alcohol dehydrogenase family)